MTAPPMRVVFGKTASSLSSCDAVPLEATCTTLHCQSNQCDSLSYVDGHHPDGGRQKQTWNVTDLHKPRFNRSVRTILYRETSESRGVYHMIVEHDFA